MALKEGINRDGRVQFDYSFGLGRLFRSEGNNEINGCIFCRPILVLVHGVLSKESFDVGSEDIRHRIFEVSSQTLDEGVGAPPSGTRV